MTNPAKRCGIGIVPGDLDLLLVIGGGRASISSCFYMLVKYMEMPTRVFVCGGDEGTTEFKLLQTSS